MASSVKITFSEEAIPQILSGFQPYDKDDHFNNNKEQVSERRGHPGISMRPDWKCLLIQSCDSLTQGRQEVS